jgi:hypothetical protein
LLFDDAVGLMEMPADTPEVPVVFDALVTDPALDLKVVAPGPVQVVIVALTVAKILLYKLQL